MQRLLKDYTNSLRTVRKYYAKTFTQQLRKETWVYVISQRNLGFFAQLRKERVAVAVATENLRPMGVISAPVDENAQQCIEGGTARRRQPKGGKNEGRQEKGGKNICRSQLKVSPLRMPKRPTN